MHQTLNTTFESKSSVVYAETSQCSSFLRHNMTDPTLRLQSFTGPINDADPNASFKREVTYYSDVDPIPTLESMSKQMQIPVGAIARYILVKWATSGNEGIWR
jgi:hypothetical protein